MSTHLFKRFHRFLPTLLLVCAASILLHGGTCGGEGKLRQALTVTFIDVGQGDSILVQCPDGQNILVDGGPTKAGPKVVEYLKERGVKKLDIVITTHPDLDHIGGLPTVVRAFPVDSMLIRARATPPTATRSCSTSLRRRESNTSWAAPVTYAIWGMSGSSSSIRPTSWTRIPTIVRWWPWSPFPGLRRETGEKRGEDAG